MPASDSFHDWLKVAAAELRTGRPDRGAVSKAWRAYRKARGNRRALKREVRRFIVDPEFRLESVRDAIAGVLRAEMRADFARDFDSGAESGKAQSFAAMLDRKE